MYVKPGRFRTEESLYADWADYADCWDGESEVRGPRADRCPLSAARYWLSATRYLKHFQIFAVSQFRHIGDLTEVVAEVFD